jgi:hypothetical protein
MCLEGLRNHEERVRIISLRASDIRTRNTVSLTETFGSKSVTSVCDAEGVPPSERPHFSRSRCYKKLISLYACTRLGLSALELYVN